MADEKNDAATEPEQPRKGPAILENKVVLLGVIVILQAVMAFGITQFVIVPKLNVQAAGMEGAETQEALQSGPDMGIIVGLEEIIVTLQSRGKAPNYLRINVNLEVDTQATADLVVSRLPQLRDIVIMTLSSKNAAELSSVEGTQSVRSEIFRRLAEKLPPESLKSIYFSDLVIQ
jgi:flagellar basal body-associated protein FliL